MHSKLIFWVYIFISANVAVDGNPFDAKIQQAELTGLKDSSSSCGGKLLAASGTISYKSFHPYVPNERCVWTARAPNATSFSVTVETLGTTGLVTITGFGLPGFVKQSIPTSASTTSFPSTNVLVIVFSTTDANNTSSFKGFSLRYTTSASGSNRKASEVSEDIIVPANIGHIRYPSNVGSNYGNFDLSTILITSPILGVYKSSGKVELIYIRNGFEGQSCEDKLRIYTFDRNLSSNRWRLLGQMCGGVDSELIMSQDIILIVFESDGSGVGSGFHLYSRYIQ